MPANQGLPPTAARYLPNLGWKQEDATTIQPMNYNGYTIMVEPIHYLYVVVDPYGKEILGKFTNTTLATQSIDRHIDNIKKMEVRKQIERNEEDREQADRD